MSGNLEKEFRADIIRSALAHGYHLVDIPDELKNALAVFPELAPKLKGFIRKKPYDLGFLSQGRYCGLELKRITDAFSFVPRNVFDVDGVQHEQLQECRREGGFGGLLVNFRFAVTAKQKEKMDMKSWLLDLTYLVPSAIIDVDHRYTLRELQTDSRIIELKHVDGLYDLEPIWTST